MEALAALAALALMILGIHCHRRWYAIFPEDPPGHAGRHRHREPTPMAGFVPAAVALFGFATTTPLCGWLLAAVAVATIAGYFDDRGKAEGEDMAWHKKGLLLAAAAALVAAHFAWEYPLGILDLILITGFVFAVTNAVNFLDNTDGVAASLGGSALLFASDFSGALAIAGFAFLGFLPSNWPRSRAFLGDSGSLSLGVCVAIGALLHAVPALAPATTNTSTFAGLEFWLAAVLPPIVFLLDFVQVITARLILGVPPWVGDRRHLSHILNHAGVPRVLVAPVFVAIAWTVYLAI